MKTLIVFLLLLAMIAFMGWVLFTYPGIVAGIIVFMALCYVLASLWSLASYLAE